MVPTASSVIRFGTDGWRAVIADQFTFDNVRAVAQALATTWKQEAEAGDRPVVVGFDTRFLSDRFALAAAEVMAANGFRVMMADRPCSSPAVSWAVKEHGAIGAVMLTASHNPPEYNGFKIKAHYGGSASPELTARVERALGGAIATYAGEPIARFDPRTGYFAQLRRLVDVEAIARAGLHVIADPMHGAGSGYLTELFAGTPLDLTELHRERNPGFNGTNPEPIAPNLRELVDRVRGEAMRHPLTVGLAFDGDADRIGAVDATGEFVNSHQILCLLLQHLVERKGWTGGVIRTFSTSRMVEKMAKAYGLRLFETPIGFKYICDLMVHEDILIGGEESGGIGVKNHLPERDGILCGLLLLEIVAATGATLGELVQRLEAIHGPHRYDRIDLHLTDHAVKDRVLQSLRAHPPTAFAGLSVTDVETTDGIKFGIENGGWLLFRASGTEPLLRIYSESPDMSQVEALLAAGRAYAEGA
jgi:phosphomannomutase